MIRKHWSLLTEHQDCDICPASESASHIVLRCFPASVIWATFHMNDLASSSTDIVHFMHRAQQAWINSRGVHILFAAAAVTLWHARNDRIFNNKRWPPSYLRREVHDEVSQARQKASTMKHRRQEQESARREKLRQAFLKKRLDKLMAEKQASSASDDQPNS
uniref:Reverse transcriptase zinc-binding domain-containing protein n=2 Tax=Triticum urartu TaxID=4572 RepID=A0A8R7TW21_TRIUA